MASTITVTNAHGMYVADSVAADNLLLRYMLGSLKGPAAIAEIMRDRLTDVVGGMIDYTDVHTVSELSVMLAAVGAE